MTNKDNTESKDFYTDFFENAPEAMALLDADGNVVHCNLAHQSIFGFTQENSVGQFYGDFFQSCKSFTELLNALKTHGQVASPILRIKGESPLDVQLRANGIYNAQGSLINVRMSVRDVTTQKQAELLRAIQHETTMLLVGSASILEALNQVTERLRLWLEYDVAIVWKEQGKDNRLARVVMNMNTDDTREKHDYLLSRSISIPLAIGAGYPATAWFSGKTERLTLTNQTVIFSEQASRISREYKDIVTFPINIGRHTWGLVSFFSQKGRALDASVLEALASIGLQIGQFVDRIEAIEAYSRSQERYYVAISGSNDGIWDWDLLSNEVFYSPRYKEQLGFEDHEIGNNFEVFRSLCHPDDYPRVMDEVQRHIEEKVPYDVEFRMRTKSGDYKWISAKGQAVWNAQGKPVRMAGSHRDIDELKAAEAARSEYERKLLNSEQMFRQLAENIRDTFWILDLPSGAFLYVSPACETIFEKSSQDLYRDPEQFYSGVKAEDVQYVRKILTEGDIPETGKEFEYRFGTRWLWSRVFPVRDQKGVTTRLCGITHDITEKKEVERRVSEFYSTVSHELRTPLTSIRAALGLIEGGLTGEIPEETLEYTSIARDNCDRLIRLINDILDIRKLEAQKLELRLRNVNGRQAVLHTMESLKAYAEQKGVKMEYTGAEITQECIADSDRLLQILTNLVSNAIKFSPVGKTVEILVEDDGLSMVKFLVTDHGVGIKEEELKELFGLFQQLSSLENQENTGSGLGLAISKALVEKMGGRIGVESKPGAGATFWFTLPAATFALSMDIEAGQGDSGPHESAGARILLLEDSDSIAMLLKAFLRRKGFQATRASNIAEAKAMSQKLHYDLIFADINLPDGNGVDFINWLHKGQADRATPVIILSGSEDPGLALDHPELVDYVRKPFDGEALLKILEKRLNWTNSPSA